MCTLVCMCVCFRRARGGGVFAGAWVILLRFYVTICMY